MTAFILLATLSGFPLATSSAEWRFDRHQNPMNDEWTGALVVPALGEDGEDVRLAITCEEDSMTTRVRVFWRRQFFYVTTPEPKVMFRIDEEPVRTETWAAAEYRDGTVVTMPLFLSSSAPPGYQTMIGFIKGLVGANRLAVQVEGQHPVVFRLFGLEKALEPIQSLCNWPPERVTD